MRALMATMVCRICLDEVEVELDPRATPFLPIDARVPGLCPKCSPGQLRLDLGPR